MRRISLIAVVLGLMRRLGVRPVLAEGSRAGMGHCDSSQRQLQAQQAESMAAGLNLKAARSDRLPSIRTSPSTRS